MKEPSIAFVGDIMLSRGVGVRLAQSPDSPIVASKLAEVLSKADYRIGNLECPVSRNAPRRREGLFRADPSSLRHIRQFDLLTVANNHIHDCGRQGLEDTIEALRSEGYAYTGLCKENGEADTYTCVVGELRIGVLATARSECIPVSESGRWEVNRADGPAACSIITEMRHSHDRVVAIVHGGNEMIPEPPPTLIDLAHKYVDAGADLVVTHHPHVLGGMETYKNAPIFYGLGDFIFDGQSNLRRRGAVLTVTFGKEDTICEVTYTIIGKDLTVDVADQKTEVISQKGVERVSGEVVSDDYAGRYNHLYRVSLIRFQLDRLIFLLRNRGVSFVVSFAISRARLIPHYFNSILNNRHR